MKAILIFVFLSGLFIAITRAGCPEVRNTLAQDEGGDKMEPAEAATVKEPSLPPIDRNIPEKLETATFALG